MIQTNVYRYYGRNGIITSKVLLDGISHIPMMELKAEDGMVLTDGKRFVSRINVFIEDIDKWHEITDPNNGQT